MAAGGNAEAFMVLVRRYRAPLIAHIHGRTRGRDEAEDIAQDVFCKAWQHLPRLRSPAAFAGWLFRIADNAIATAARKPRPTSLDDDPADGPARGPSMNSSVDVHAAVSELSHEHRVVVWLCHFSGMSTDEAARVVGVAPGTVRSRLSRAYAELRERLTTHSA
jgi:RNA polymerase sigma-70 factor (ECF subfamily)